MNAQANELANQLMASLPPDSFVGILVEKSPEMVSAILGVLKAGLNFSRQFLSGSINHIT